MTGSSRGRWIALAGALLFAGCAGMPQQYDGVVGYRVETVDGDMRATYVDEVRVSRERMLARLSLVCRNAGAPALAPVVTSEEEFVQDGYFRITLPGGGEPMGDYLSTPGGTRQFVMHEETFPGRVKLRKIVVLCPAPPSTEEAR